MVAFCFIFIFILGRRHSLKKNDPTVCPEKTKILSNNITIFKHRKFAIKKVSQNSFHFAVLQKLNAKGARLLWLKHSTNTWKSPTNLHHHFSLIKVFFFLWKPWGEKKSKKKKMKKKTFLRHCDKTQFVCVLKQKNKCYFVTCFAIQTKKKDKSLESLARDKNNVCGFGLSVKFPHLRKTTKKKQGKNKNKFRKIKKTKKWLLFFALFSFYVNNIGWYDCSIIDNNVGWLCHFICFIDC